MRDRILLDPEYQRLSDIWTMDKRQLLIDTILNEFDVPKLYLHKFHEPVKRGAKSYDYAIIDGSSGLKQLVLRGRKDGSCGGFRVLQGLEGESGEYDLCGAGRHIPTSKSIRQFPTHYCLY